VEAGTEGGYTKASYVHNHTNGAGTPLVKANGAWRCGRWPLFQPAGPALLWVVAKGRSARGFSQGLRLSNF